jgi:hypothetical protein
MKAELRFITITKMTTAVAAFSLVILVCLTAQAEAKRTHVTGHEGNYAGVPGYTAHYYTDGAEMFVFGAAIAADDNITAADNPSDMRLTGKMTYHYTVDMGEGMFWGTAHLVPTIGGGEWDGFWQGPLSGERPISITLLGQGKFAGLVARLNYTPGTVYYYDIDGYIVEAKGGPGDRPFKISAISTEEVEVHSCMEVVQTGPSTFVPVDPPVYGVVFKGTILSQVMEATHMGRSSNSGFSLLNPLTGEFTGTGIATAANGDKVYWVDSFDLDWITSVSHGSVNFCGGTGQLDPAFGWFNFETQDNVPDPTNPLISTIFYTGSGTIRY